jgi:hypothetical protein
MTGLKALRRLCRCGCKGVLQPIPLCHCLHDTSIQYWTTRVISNTFTGLTNGRALHRLRCQRCSSTSSEVGSCTDHVCVSRASSDGIQPGTALENVLQNYIRGSSITSFDLPELIIDLLPDMRHFPPPSTSSHLLEELEPSISQRLDTISSSYCSSLPTKGACDSWRMVHNTACDG